MTENNALPPENNSTPTSEASPAQKRKARITFLAIVGLFFIPYFIVPLLFNPADMGQTNKGTLITPHIQIADLQLQQGAKNLEWPQLEMLWRMMYILPAQCDAACENAIYVMRQVRRSMDRNIQRIGIIVVHSEISADIPTNVFSKDYPGAIVLEASSEKINTAMQVVSNTGSALQAGLIYLVAPDGQIFLSHPSYTDQQEAVMKAKDLRKDLKKTIKGSRI